MFLKKINDWLLNWLNAEDVNEEWGIGMKEAEKEPNYPEQINRMRMERNKDVVCAKTHRITLLSIFLFFVFVIILLILFGAPN